MKGSPAFQFYPQDWLSSPKITLMSPEHEGAYIRLLCYAWCDPDLGIPDDDEQLARLSRLGEGWLKGGSTVLRKCFVDHPHVPGKLTNERLMREYKKQQQWREKSRLGGISSGKSRNSKMKGGSTTLEPTTNSLVQPKANSSFSSSSSKKKTPLTPHGGNGLYRFDEFWAAYPKKKDKEDARRAWRKLKPDDDLIQHMLEKLEQAKQTRQWSKDEGEFIPHPATWLNKRRWEDEYHPNGARPKPQVVL